MPEVVLATLGEAFKDNQALSAAVGVSADEVSLAVAEPALAQLVAAIDLTELTSGR
ncbi:hypothetical protein [Micromonospora sp. NPDC004551]|uniref:hypothetical protein n=1 Tax=Micromonospora sp. NPDC004551 TaxID=3154284 RepID=UPI0033B26DD8